MQGKLSGRKILVVGMARSGLAVADFLVRKGAQVKITDKRGPEQLSGEIRQLEKLAVKCEVGGHRLDSFLEADLVVVSPGVPLKIPEIQAAIQSGREVISEIELASRFLLGKVVGITGSNGKTTTTTLIGQILKTAGFVVQVGGNIGTALTSLVETSTPETINVVELSSFQLEAITSFRPNIAMVLNITPDHLDRYDDFEDYTHAKLNIFRNQTGSDFAVLNLEDRILGQYAGSLAARVLQFSGRQLVEEGTGFDGRRLLFQRRNQIEVSIPIEPIQLRGRHNLENVAAAITAARLLGASPATIAEAVYGFKGVEHRLELVAEYRGVQFYNDSKATNADATIKALEAFESGVIIILGGKDKGGDFSVLRPFITQRTRAVVLLGEASEKIRLQLQGTVPMIQSRDMRHAVMEAFQMAEKGDTVLLAPACASFDLFQNFEHRGREFKEAVSDLIRNQEGKN
jgi:UDP-N-acetylmuramoylalanine--D-glutamate ligase